MTVGDLTCPARILDFVMRKTLLLRPGYRDGFTRIQQWLIAHLIVQRPFDLLLGILNTNRKIRKRTDTDVAFTREYSRVSIFHRERECTN